VRTKDLDAVLVFLFLVLLASVALLMLMAYLEAWVTRGKRTQADRPRGLHRRASIQTIGAVCANAARSLGALIRRGP
jgi:hypothetical protein